MNLEFKCPYCGVLNGVWADKPEWNHRLFHCDTESGGCDEPFVAEWRFKPEVKVYKIDKEPHADN